MLSRIPAVGEYIRYRNNEQIYKVVRVDDTIVYFDDIISQPEKGLPPEYNCFIAQSYTNGAKEFNPLFTIVTPPNRK